MAQPNIALLDSTLKLITDLEAAVEADPTGKTPYRWHQGAWISMEDIDNEDHPVVDETGLAGLPVDCNTAFCFAGWVAQNAGGKWVESSALLAEPEDPDEVVHLVEVEPIDKDGNPLPMIEVEAVTAAARAQRLLGLTGMQAVRLFAGGNSITDLRNIVEAIKAGERDPWYPSRVGYTVLEDDRA